MNNTILHNVKMIALVLISLVLSVIGMLHSGMNFTEWVAVITTVLLGLEHYFNGNTPANIGQVPTPTQPEV